MCQLETGKHATFRSLPNWVQANSIHNGTEYVDSFCTFLCCWNRPLIAHSGPSSVFTHHTFKWSLIYSMSLTVYEMHVYSLDHMQTCRVNTACDLFERWNDNPGVPCSQQTVWSWHQHVNRSPHVLLNYTVEITPCYFGLREKNTQEKPSQYKRNISIDHLNIFQHRIMSNLMQCRSMIEIQK